MTEDGSERVYFDAPPSTLPGDVSWWTRYAAEMTSLTSSAQEVLQTDCAYIVDQGIFGVGQPNVARWPANRTRTGLVMGSVQSGKTASMLGVTALSLDRGVDIVVILAGTRLSLWRQTYERLTEQLDAEENSVSKATRRLLCPAPGVALSEASVSLRDTYRLSSAQVRRKLGQRRPLIVVAMKQTDHLYALGNMLRQSVFGAFRDLGRPAHMLVLDDEADDGSVLDAVVEAGQDPLSPKLKQIPRAIADLWEPRSGSSPENLFTTYVGYTATPQASLLQEDHNPLAPRDFVISLRTPLDVGQPLDPSRSDAPRSSTYPEPTGIDNYYIGGEVFYRRGTAANLCIELSEQPEEDLGEALRAFLVAGAIRLYRSGRAAGPASLARLDFDTSAAARTSSPDPHSMLFHPSAEIDQHFTGAEDILLWAGVRERHLARELLESGNALLPPSLIQKMRGEECLWAGWLDRYRHSSAEITNEFNVQNSRPFPTWDQVRNILEAEIIPGTRVSVVNSDPAADDRPEYKPSFNATTGTWHAARDLSTIFVSGNVMARGLTLEGMTTALFQRESNSPLADTQMQMQRWFGYRGKHLELCRLFASRRQIDLFGAYHDLDEALREGITAQMTGNAPSPVVLHGMSFLATGKIANLSRRPLCPGSRPFVTLLNDGYEPDPNAQVVANLFASRESSDVIVGPTTRGRALEETLSLAEAAEVLDQFVYDSYRPGRENPLGELWDQIQARLSAIQVLGGSALYDPPGPSDGEASPVRLNCPYTIPAYLRLWEACLTRPVRGLFVTGTPSGRWSMANLERKQRQQPRFTVGIRYGSGEPVRQGPLAELGFSIPTAQKRVGSDGELETTWGANNPGAGPLDYRGDEFFDYYHRGERVPRQSGNTPWRPEGSCGQILFYVNQLPGQPYPVVAVGVCIPAGGPEQFAATRVGSLSAG